MIDTCSTCGAALGAGNSYVYGNRRRCKACAKEQARAWYSNNRARALANMKARRAAILAAEGGGPPGPHCRDRTHCAQGHPFAGANVYHWRGRRRCRACQSASRRRRYQRRQEKRNG